MIFLVGILDTLIYAITFHSISIISISKLPRETKLHGPPVYIVLWFYFSICAAMISNLWTYTLFYIRHTVKDLCSNGIRYFWLINICFRVNLMFSENSRIGPHSLKLNGLRELWITQTRLSSKNSHGTHRRSPKWLVIVWTIDKSQLDKNCQLRDNSLSLR